METNEEQREYWLKYEASEAEKAKEYFWEGVVVTIIFGLGILALFV